MTRIKALNMIQMMKLNLSKIEFLKQVKLTKILNLTC